MEVTNICLVLLASVSASIHLETLALMISSFIFADTVQALQHVIIRFVFAVKAQLLSSHKLLRFNRDITVWRSWKNKLLRFNRT